SFPESTNRRLPRPTTFPYTTLFRSRLRRGRATLDIHKAGVSLLNGFREHPRVGGIVGAARIDLAELTGGEALTPGVDDRGGYRRSEEHTSELQSRENLVCRLLLEKK